MYLWQNMIKNKKKSHFAFTTMANVATELIFN